MKNIEFVYISGPISGYDINERREAFENAEIELYKKGYFTVNPFANGLSEKDSYEHHMKADIARLLLCNKIFMLDGWEKSKGAQLEYQVAMACGIYELKFD